MGLMFFDSQPEAEVVEFIREHYKGGSVIDFGCGAGRYTEFFDDYTGVDGYQDNITACKARYPDKKFLCRDLNEWKPKKKYDYLFSSVVFDQIEKLPKGWAKTYILIEPVKYKKEFNPDVCKRLSTAPVIRMMLCKTHTK